jgi:hypothetical protein
VPKKPYVINNLSKSFTMLRCISMASDDNSIWCFTNSKKPTLSIDVMSLKSARDFVALLRKEELSLWMVRRKDLVAAAEHLLHVEILFQRGNEASPAIRLASRSKNYDDRRSHRRTKVRLNVVICREKEVFHACTTDISVGGMRLANPIPRSFMFHTCRVIICSADGKLNVEFEAMILEASINGSRIMFNNMSAASLTKLKEWLDSKRVAA